MDGQGKLERTRKNMEKSGNLKNSYGRHLSENLFILFENKKDVLSHEIVSALLPPHWGLLLEERICSSKEQIVFFKSNSKT